MSFIGDLFSGGSDQQAAANTAGAQANDYRQQASNLWNNLQIPNLSTTPYGRYATPDTLSLQNYDPYIGQATQTADDPESVNKMRSALDQLEDFSKGGLLPADMVALQDIDRAQAGAGTQAYNATRDALAQRGLGGSGADLAARLSADQTASENSRSLYDSALQTALTRQLGATTAAGNLAGNIRTGTQNINDQMAQIANNFNTQVQNLRTNAAQNAATNANQAATFNLQNKQAVGQQNTAIDNQNLDRNNQIQQTNFNNQTQKLQGQSNALNGQATAASATQAADAKQALGTSQNGLAGLGLTLGALKNGSQITDGVSSLGKSVGNIFGSGTGGAAANSATSLLPDMSTNIDPSTFDYFANGGSLLAS